ncbi:MAG: PDZ domain-containing protein [Planctomycetes bacterium]|nr:PDZ domain-containing protein [Planctomycetota bacterium]
MSLRHALPLACTLLAALSAVHAEDSYEKPKNPAGPPMLGVEMTPVPTSVQEKEGLQPGQGVLVQSIFNDTAAQSMHLQPGDVVLAINGQTIGSMTDLRNEVGLNQPGDPIDVTYQRSGQQFLASGIIKPWPSNIPREPIDPAMEKQFQDWQQHRLERSQDEITDLQKQADTLAHGAAAQAAADQGAFGGLRLAGPQKEELAAKGWHFTYRYHPAFAPANPAAATVAEAPVFDDGQTTATLLPPWHFDWRVGAAAKEPRTPRHVKDPI